MLRISAVFLLAAFATTSRAARAKLVSREDYQIQKREVRPEVPCTPDQWKAIGKNGFCATSDNLDVECADREISASLQDCAGFDGAWCCYVPVLGTNSIKANFAPSASGSYNYGGYSTGGPFITTPSRPVTTPRTWATSTYAVAPSIPTVPVTTYAPVTPTTSTARTTRTMVPTTGATVYGSYAAPAPAATRRAHAKGRVAAGLMFRRKNIGQVAVDNDAKDLFGGH